MRAAGILLVCALVSVADPPDPDALAERHRSARRAWGETTIALEGRILDESGAPAAARVIAGEVEAETDADGGFRFPALPRRNVLLTVRSHGWFDEVRAVHLARGLDTSTVRFDTLRLRARLPGRSRLVFGGDVMMGRRFLRPEHGPPPLLDAATLPNDTRRVLRDVAPLLRTASLTVVNLETSISRRQRTPVSAKAYNFWSPPETLDALRWAGVDGVTLGNNHVWDYGERGFLRTKAALEERGMAWCGAGTDEIGAKTPAVLGDFRLLSYSGIRGTDVPLQARGARGGAAAMTPRAIREGVARASKEGRVIVALHSGKEYSDHPTGRMRAAAAAAAKAGALLVVGHHAHTPQGLALQDGVLVAWCLANLVFDQTRWEALTGILLVVDVGPEGVEGARVIPIVQEGFIPRPATGDLGRAILRRIASLSPDVPLRQSAGAAEIVLAGGTETRRCPGFLEVRAGVPVRALRDDAGEWIRNVDGPPGAVIEAGRDLLGTGGFEDDAVGSPGPPARWFLGPGAHISNDGPLTGAACLLLHRGGSSASLVHRVPVPGRFTLVGHSRHVNRGVLRVRCSFQATSASGLAFEEASRDIPAAGPGWTPFALDLQRPAGARTLALEFSVGGDGTVAVFLDDLAIVDWSPAAGPLPPLHTADFLRSSVAGTLDIEWAAGIR